MDRRRPRRPGRRPRPYLERRRTFHDTTVGIGGARELARVMPPRTDVFRAQVEMVRSRLQRARHVSGYARIADAIIAGDGADRAVKRHSDGARQTIEELPLSAFPTPEPE